MHVKNNAQQKTNIKKSSSLKQWEFQDKNIKQFSIICSSCVKQDTEVNKVTSNISSNMQQVKSAQIMGAISPKWIILYDDAHYFWDLWMELALYHPFGAYIFLAGPKLLENLWTQTRSYILQYTFLM